MGTLIKNVSEMRVAKFGKVVLCLFLMFQKYEFIKRATIVYR